jgi:hypothetical protein
MKRSCARITSCGAPSLLTAYRVFGGYTHKDVNGGFPSIRLDTLPQRPQSVASLLALSLPQSAALPEALLLAVFFALLEALFFALLLAFLLQLSAFVVFIIRTPFFAGVHIFSSAL